MTRYVIVGGGPAGINAATTIRAKDPEGSILLLDRDQDPPYYRTELDTYIAGSTPDSELPLNPESFYQEQRIEIRSRTTVSRLKPSERAVELEGDGALSYDALLLAPGSVPVEGAWPGRELQGIMTVRTWEDAREAVRRLTETEAPVVVVGGGVLGLLLCEGIQQRTRRAVLLEREPRLWAPFLDDHASGIISNSLAQAGVELRLEAEIAEAIGESGRVRAIRTSKGLQIDTSLVIVTIGAIPDIRFLEGSGVRTDRGILIDHEFRTNVPEIFAAGDAAQAYDPVSGLFRVVTNWKNAVEQGRLAGAAMAGEPTSYKGVIVSNSETFFGVRVSVMGHTDRGTGGLVELTGRDDAKGVYRKLFVREDRLVGAILLGNVSGEGMMKKAIIDRKPLPVVDAKSKFLTGLIIEETVTGDA